MNDEKLSLKTTSLDSDSNSLHTYMNLAIEQAEIAQSIDEVPIGCVIVQNGKVIACGYNQRETLQRATAHAEIMAIEEACRKLNTWRLEECDLYVTLEPCPMCAGAIIQSRIRNVYFGAYDPKGGSVETCTSLFTIPQYNHHPDFYGGIMQEECSQLLKDFFASKRLRKKLEKKSASVEKEN